MATKVGAYLKGVFKGTGGHNWDGRNGQGIDSKVIAIGTALNSKNVYNLSELNSHIGAVEGAIDTSRASNATVQPILEAGKQAFMAALKMPNYTRMNYDAANTIQWNSETPEVKSCANIFLGCLPLYYQALTYIYWGCHENGGGWGNLTLANGAMRSYFDSQGLLPLYVDKSKRGAHIAETALGGFSEFGTAAASSLSSANSTYASFNEKLQKKVGENVGDLPKTCPLSALFHGASCYFRYQQIKNAKSAVGAPKTIREMLYFLAALQFSSAYDEVEGHIGTLLTNQLDVADSPETKDNNTLSAADLKEYLRASSSLSSAVLGTLQGGNGTGNSDPWLHELFCNSAFQFKYPSGPILFSNVSSYAYALQFQLLFLYSMCANNVNKCGWQHCTYGKEINASGISVLQSHICQGLKCNGDTRCNHTKGSSQCNHNKYTDGQSCGKGSNGPPSRRLLLERFRQLALVLPPPLTTCPTTIRVRCATCPWGFRQTISEALVTAPPFIQS
ncbi:variant erythrocyte surface antigen-1 family protein [Babesia caballi]|uniref:Variant erythrocyte surface antigen-1 family protein n=1 Tax=Babesia caballi TaxID=5871 RepID=A0AAV4LZU3_BABCB|nr:variant erythrocyte surface antigen-1 family protein [Babesia caballi]